MHKEKPGSSLSAQGGGKLPAAATRQELIDGGGDARGSCRGSICHPLLFCAGSRIPASAWRFLPLLILFEISPVREGSAWCGIVVFSKEFPCLADRLAAFRSLRSKTR